MLNQTPNTNNSAMQSGLPGNMLKIFAAMTMLLDHTALTIVYALLEKHPDYWKLVTSTESTTEQLNAIPADYMNLFTIYTILRLVGRIAFPLFCFLIYEGFVHTSDVKRYLTRLGILALVSELPFNLIVSRVNTGKSALFYPQLQNTVLALFLALLMLTVMKRMEAAEITPKATIKQFIGQLVCLLVFAVVAILCRVDYSYLGILAIGAFYLFRNSKKLQIICGAVLFLSSNIAALFAFIPISMYNGTLLRSKKFQYFFYIFYPAHLLVLYGISLLL